MSDPSAPAHIFLPATPDLLIELSAQRETQQIAAYEASPGLVELIEASGESAADALEYAEYTALSVAAEDAFAQVEVAMPGRNAADVQAAVIVADVDRSGLTLDSDEDGICKYVLDSVPVKDIACYFRVARHDDSDDQPEAADTQAPDTDAVEETGPVTWWYGKEELDELAALLTATEG